ncbi:MAG: hypothetical protein WDO71_15955 [Bacteroidota bacterium]
MKTEIPLLFLSICNNKVCGKHIYSYSNGLLVSHKNFNSWTSYQNNINESKWESTLLSNEFSFSYTGNKLTGFEQYISTKETVFIENELKYDATGKLIAEIIRTYNDTLNEKFETINYVINDRKEYA